MRTAVLSDIHANLEALQAVLDDLQSRNVDRIVSLGDVVGYGPNPRECLELAMLFDFHLMGRFEHALLVDSSPFKVDIQKMLAWTRREIETVEKNEGEGAILWAFLQTFEDQHIEDNLLFVHGSPRDPTHEFTLSTDVHVYDRMEEYFSHINWICFCGSSHIPGIINQAPEWIEPPDQYTPLGRKGKFLINPGAVGQPRDGDTRASYLIFDGQGVEFHRIEYDIEATAAKIEAIDALPDHLAERLRYGR